jgi:hypothetical protein
MERVITLLAGLSQAEVNTLASEGCTSGEDLSLCTLLDIEQIMLSETPVVKRRKLYTTGSYMARGQTIEEATTMPTVANHLNTVAVAAVAPNLLPPLPPPPPGPSPFQDPNRGAPKLYTNAIENFSGSPMDFEAAWEKKTRALLGQTSYEGLMTTPPEFGDLVPQKRNRELYHMFTMTAIMDGSGLTRRTCGGVDGDPWLVQSGFDHYRNKLETLRLDEGTEASTYVNDVIIFCQKLEEKNEGVTLCRCQKFLDQITDEEYDVAKQWLTGDENKTFDDCVVKIRAREQHLHKEGNDSLLKARRFKKNEESKPKSGGIPGQTIPSIPGYILYKLKWRGMYNSVKDGSFEPMS